MLTKFLVIACLAVVVVGESTAPHPADATPSCIIKSNSERIFVGHGCRAKQAILPRGMKVTFR